MFGRFKKKHHPKIELAPVEDLEMAPVQAGSDRAEAVKRRTIDEYALIAKARGIDLSYPVAGGPITVTKGKERFIVAAEHYLYACDFCNQFDYYFSSTVPEEIDGFIVADFSRPGWHTMRATGERLFFTSMAEDQGATTDYLKYLVPQPGDVVLDIGSYCGLSVLAFSQAVGAEGRVLAFEADPRTIDALRTNTKNADNVTIINKAVAGSSGAVLFSSEASMGSAIVAKETERGKTVEVEAVTLDSIVNDYKLTRIDVVKVDIEGAEYGVLESSADILARFPARWAVELHADPVTGSPVDVERVRKIFDRHDYATVLQQSGEMAAAPTLFAVPPEQFLRGDSGKSLKP
jgi:FkbM family methyltransferase